MTQVQTVMPENLRDAWLAQDKTVAKSRPALLRISIDQAPGDATHWVIRGWYMLNFVLRQASVSVEAGGVWEDALAQALEDDYQARVKGSQA